MLGFRRTLGSYYETHKGTVLEPLRRQPGSGLKSGVGMTQLAPDFSTARAYI